MTSERRQDVILIALVVSAALHVGLMMWARPQVMTHVSSVDRGLRRGAMHVRKAEIRDDAAKLSLVEDVKASKEAPKAEDSGELPSAVSASLPVPEALVKSPEAAEAPKIAENFNPEALKPAIFPSEAKGLGVVTEKPQILSYETPSFFLTEESPSVSVGSAGGGRQGKTGGARPEATPPKAPAPAMPAVSIPVAPAVERVAKFEREKEVKAVEFKTIAEVMPEVDEKVVAKEKAAVRELVNADTAADLNAAVKVDVSAASAGGYTYFKARITPKNAVLRAVPKDFVILLDASGSIGGDRLASCRKAARQILRSSTNSGDRFNLVAFRDRFSYAFKTWRECDKAGFDAGDRWLSNLAAHGRTDVFSTISSVLTLPREPSRPLIALVVTDGDANSGVSDTDEILRRFAALNDGLISVYMYGVKASANRRLINVLTHTNRGESFIFDGWRWSAGSGIEGLSERFRDPLLTDLRVVFPATSPAEAYPIRLRNLYAGNEVNIYGQIKGSPKEVVFSLKGLAGAKAYEGYFHLPLNAAKTDMSVVSAFNEERKFNFEGR